MKFETVLASSVAVLDSSVTAGGGTDDTAALQAVLDRAGEDYGIRLLMDGAALVSGLKVCSNTRIECLSKDCGFYLKDNSDCAVLSTRKMSPYTFDTHDVTLTGGTYNQNCLHQIHDRAPFPGEEEVCFREGNAALQKWTFGLEFYGIRDLTVRDLTIRDARTFALTVGGFRNVLIENVWMDLPNRMQSQNQDGLHFWGPGQFLTVRNCGGTVGDDFMNLGPDELDRTSSISDVLIDGIFLDHADQGIRMLCRQNGVLDRVTVRNVTGTYRSFGFFINPWYVDTGFGNYHDILLENICLQAEPANYTYREPVLFAVGGNIRGLTLRNIRCFHPSDGRALVELGVPLHSPYADSLCTEPMEVDNVVLEDFTVIEEDGRAYSDYIRIFAPVKNLFLTNLTVLRGKGSEASGSLIGFYRTGCVEHLVMRGVYAPDFASVLSDDSRVEHWIFAGELTEHP